MRGTGGRLTVTPPGRLRDGAHSVDVRFHSANVFARTVARRWDFDVDTAAPKLAVASPRTGGLVARRAVKFAGTAEPGTQVTVAYTGGRPPRPPRRRTAPGRRSPAFPRAASPPPSPARTAAGNTTERRRTVTVDTTAPDLAITAPAAGATASPRRTSRWSTARCASDSPRNLTFSASVNGKAVATAKGSDATTPASLETSYGAGRRGAGEHARGRRQAVRARGRDAAAGPQRITVFGARPGRQLRTQEHRRNVDSTEEFGAGTSPPAPTAPTSPHLQQRLREAEVHPTKAKLTGVIDDDLAKSDRPDYQKRYPPAKHRVSSDRTTRDGDGRAASSSTHRPAQAAAHPQRQGREDLQDRRRPAGLPDADRRRTRSTTSRSNPTWCPPDCRGPPGSVDHPARAAATRSAPGGSAPRRRTSASTGPTRRARSIGTRASHGCMRMHITDVEELYDQVSIGMTVQPPGVSGLGGGAVTEANWDERVSGASTLVLVDFWAPWCDPCRRVSRSSRTSRPPYGERLVVGSLNATRRRAITARYDVLSLPTLLLFSDGEPVARVVARHRMRRGRSAP